MASLMTIVVVVAIASPASLIAIAMISSALSIRTRQRIKKLAV